MERVITNENLHSWRGNDEVLSALWHMLNCPLQISIILGMVCSV